MTTSSLFKNLYLSILLLSSVSLFAKADIETNQHNLSSSSFTENKGQVANTDGKPQPDIFFTGNSNGTSVFFRKTGISYVLFKSEPIDEKDFNNIEKLSNLNYYSHRIDVDFEGCNKNTSYEKQHETSGHKNFYYAHCPDGITNVKSYNTLIQKNIYNNIDLVYNAANSDGLKYDIIVNPGGNPGDIRIKYSGSDKISVDKGVLSIETSLGKILEAMPKVYQNIAGKIIDVKAEYTLDNTIVTFKLGTFNAEYPLVIDPWVTYFGGTGADYGYGITTDATGNVVFTGSTLSNNFPLLGAFQGTLSGTSDAFVVKMNASGTLLWSTYYGGSSFEPTYAICGNANNDDIYFAGNTTSSNFPIGSVGGQTIFMSTYPTNGGAYLVKLDAAGTRLWSTFYGDATTGATITSLTTDANNNVLFGGYTSTTNNIATPGTFQSVPQINSTSGDAFVVKFGPTGIRQWGSYCGGTNTDHISGISCNAANEIYIVGYTTSTDFPVSPGAHQTTLVQGGTSGASRHDAFLIKLSAAGTGIWSTFYGGPLLEYAFDVKVDLNGDVYIAGSTESTTNISQAPSLQSAKNAGTTEDGFLAKFSPAGALIWATYLGGSAREYISGIIINNNNNVLVGGTTYSLDFPVTSCAYQTTFTGTAQQFITSFDANCNLICSGFAGGTGNPSNAVNSTQNQGSGTVAQSRGNIYILAQTFGNYATTSNAYQPIWGGNADAAIIQLCSNTCGENNIDVNFNANNTTVCAGNSVSFLLQNNSCNPTNTTYQWSFTGATPASSTQQNPTNIVYNATGAYSVKVVITTPCGKDSITKAAYINVGSLSTTINYINPTTCYGTNDGSASISASGGTGPYLFLWNNNNTTSTASNLSAGIYTATVSDATGCTSSISVTITQPTQLIANINSNSSTICSGQSASLNSTTTGGASPYSYTWSNANTTSSITIQPTATTLYTVIITDNNGCSATTSAQINVNPLPIVEFNSNINEGCSELCISFNNTGTIASYEWNFGDGSSSSSINSHCYSQPGSYNVSLTLTNTNGCSATLTKNGFITVFESPTAAFTSNPSGTIISNSPIVFSNQSSNAIGYVWQFGDLTNSTSTEISPSFVFSDDGNYTVTLTATNEFGCADVAFQTFSIYNEYTIYIPNSFTPNGDGRNDVFTPKFSNINSEDFLLMVFDRWGNLIFETTNLNEGWDGRVKGSSEIAQIDTYVWKIKYKDSFFQVHDYHGHINLLK